MAIESDGGVSPIEAYISTNVTDLHYIDDLKIFAASKSKLNRVLGFNGTLRKCCPRETGSTGV